MATGRAGDGYKGGLGGSSLTEQREVKLGERGRWGAGRGFILADSGRDMTPVGEETEYKGRNRGGGGGAEMEETERERGG